MVLDEISRIQETASHLETEEAEWYISFLVREQLFKIYLSHTRLRNFFIIKRSFVYLTLFLRHIAHTHPQNIVNVTCKTMQDFHGQMQLLKTEIDRWNEGHFTTVVLGTDDERVKKLQHILSDYDIEADIVEGTDILLPGRLQIAVGDLHAGFEMPMQKLVVITEKELFHKKLKNHNVSRSYLMLNVLKVIRN